MEVDKGVTTSDEPSNQQMATDEVELLHVLFRNMFTKEFIESDEYMKSNMNSWMSISVEAVAKYPKVLDITTDLDIVCRALKTSNSVIVTDDHVRPNIKTEQHTIILRDVDSGVTDADVRDAFISVSCPPIVGCRSEMNSTWFVTFASESDARVALTNIRGAKLGGQPIRARLKTESMNKSFYEHSSSKSSGSAAGGPGPFVDVSVSPANSTSEYYRSPAPASHQSPGATGQSPLPPSPHHAPSVPGPGAAVPPPLGLTGPSGPFYMPMPMPGMQTGSPVFMGGGMWSPMHQMMMPMHSPMPNTGTGKGKGKKGSPRNPHGHSGNATGHYGGKPTSPRGMHGQKQYQQPIGGAPFPMYGVPPPYYGVPGPMFYPPVPLSPQVYDESVAPTVQIPSPPQRENGERRRGGSEGQWSNKDETGKVSPKERWGKKKTPKNKKKDKSTGDGEYKQQSEGFDRRRRDGGKGKDEGNGKDTKGRGKDKSGRGSNRPNKTSTKTEPQFNLESDFPTLRTSGTSGGSMGVQMSGGVTWAAAIMKAPVPASHCEDSEEGGADHLDPNVPVCESQETEGSEYLSSNAAELGCQTTDEMNPPASSVPIITHSPGSQSPHSTAPTASISGAVNDSNHVVKPLGNGVTGGIPITEVVSEVSQHNTATPTFEPVTTHSDASVTVDPSPDASSASPSTEKCNAHMSPTPESSVANNEHSEGRSW
eukprot:CAMPEP_0185018616 /NCGR_PEP_ID=MMETSP1103-20130426/1276_1 /TAXON_ID=36769 /ORGANISM="Paraphysomonas bandaiensis, Strain Caron Lab Isolate" /LENGTH=707 /DNA_ID=CAMNT_0027548481 /DNA_START=160 /DNA_END=2280 /DNA_ORIENTATION=-